MVNWKNIQSGPLGTKGVDSCTCYNLCGWFLGGSHFWGGRRSRRCRRAQGWNRHRTYVGVEDTNIDKHKLKYRQRTYLDRCGKIRVQIQNTDTSTNTDIAPCCWKCDYNYINIKNKHTTSLLRNCELYQLSVPVEDDLQQLRVCAKPFLVICDLHLVRRGSVWPQPRKSCHVESIDCKSNLWSSNQFWTKLEIMLW